jgi:redox-sensitive bicupin YhaK (pirin superfamily)
MYAGLFDGDEAASHDLAPGRLAYVHVARGAVTVNGQRLRAGDALLYRDEPHVTIADGVQAEVLVFDLPS